MLSVLPPSVTKPPTPPTGLVGFQLANLAPFKLEGRFDPADSADYRTFYVGRDDVHGVLVYLLSAISRSLVFNMFGYDDDELDGIIVNKIRDDHVFVQGTLDRSQAGGAHEKKILSTWTPDVRASFAIGQSTTHQITHTKGGVCDGLVAFEGSTNWSASGEGQFVQRGYKAQNNTLLVHVNQVEMAAFTAELNEEHAVALQQQLARKQP